MTNRQVKSKVKGRISDDWKERTSASINSTLAAMANPDILSDDSILFPSRDLESREQKIAIIEEAYKSFTIKQRMILRLLAMGLTHHQVAKALRISRFNVGGQVTRMQNKVKKLVSKMRIWE